jgi:hypothetical protein
VDERFALFAARAAEQHYVVCADEFDALGVTRKVRLRWERLGLIDQVGLRTFALAGTRRWEQTLMAGLLDLGPRAVVAGRSAAALHGLDGFAREPIEFLVPRELRDRKAPGRIATTTRAIRATDVCHVDLIRCLRPERVVLEAPLFDFTRAELENAIDSAIRLRLTTAERLRTRVSAERSAGVNGSRSLVEALVDTGGESKLERAFLRVMRRAGLPRPSLQVPHRDGARLIARVDALFGQDLVIEVEGHATHSSRRQRQADEQRRTELTLQGKRVLVFTLDDVFRRPEWTASRVRVALSGRCA